MIYLVYLSDLCESDNEYKLDLEKSGITPAVLRFLWPRFLHRIPENLTGTPKNEFFQKVEVTPSLVAPHQLANRAPARPSPVEGILILGGRCQFLEVLGR